MTTTPDPAEQGMPVAGDLHALDDASQKAEAKVTAASTTTGAVLGVIVIILTVLQGTVGITDHMPALGLALVGFLITALTAGLTYWRAYEAPHTARPDLPATQR